MTERPDTPAAPAGQILMTKKDRKEYLQDFHLQDDGKYRYEGSVYKTGLEPGRYRKSRFRFVIFSLLPILSGTAAGCFPPDVFLPRIAILLPYAAAMVSALLLALCGFRFLESGKDGTIRSYLYEKTLERIPAQTWFLTWTAAMTAAAGIVTALFSVTVRRPVLFTLWLLCIAGMGAFAAAARKTEQIMDFRP